MSHRTSYRIGGPAAMLAVCHTISALQRVIEVLTSQDVDWVVVGKGSNLLVADEGFDGCVIVLGRDFSHVEASSEAATVCAGAAVPLSKVVQTAARASLTGLEFACVSRDARGAISMDAAALRREWIDGRVSSSSPGHGSVPWAPEVELPGWWCLGRPTSSSRPRLRSPTASARPSTPRWRPCSAAAGRPSPWASPAAGLCLATRRAPRGRRASWRTAGSRAMRSAAPRSPRCTLTSS